MDSLVRVWPLESGRESNIMTSNEDRRRMEIGTPAQIVWNNSGVGKNVAVVAMKRNKVTLEIWGFGH